MSKQGYITRYVLLLKKLRAQPYASAEALQQAITAHLDLTQSRDEHLFLGLSKRTLQRDFREIYQLFGIEIAYSKREKGYYIKETVAESASSRQLIEAFDLFTTLNVSRDLTQHLFIETKRPGGTEHLFALLEAIKKGKSIRFVYQKFWDTDPSTRQLDPYALKEFKYRWYLIGKDHKDQKTKTFALDRLKDLERTTTSFTPPDLEQLKASYANAFGIIVPTDSSPRKVVLSLHPVQGKYLLTLPLHHSQEVLLESAQEIRIQLTLYITDDFIIELVSLGAKVKVISPKSLANEVKRVHGEAYGRYS